LTTVGCPFAPCTTVVPPPDAGEVWVVAWAPPAPTVTGTRPPSSERTRVTWPAPEAEVEGALCATANTVNTAATANAVQTAAHTRRIIGVIIERLLEKGGVLVSTVGTLPKSRLCPR